MRSRIKEVDLSEKQAKGLTKLQQKQRARHAYREFHDIHGIDISQVSRRNLKNRKEEITQGAAFLRNSLTQNSKPLTHEEENYYQNINVFDPRELILIELLQSSLTLRHVTGSLEQIRTNGNRLTPLRVRMAKGEAVTNGHNYLSAAEGSFNFFTLGVDRHKVAGFLDHNSNDIITIPLHTFFEKANSLADWLWVGPHYHNLIGSFHSNPIEFSGMRYSFHFDYEAKTRTYLYERKAGITFSRTLKFDEEIYKGKQIPFALALEMIIHLRFIGGSFREYFLKAIHDNQLALHEKTAIVQKVMTLLMPPDTTTEAKIPNCIPLDSEWITISYGESQKKLDTISQYKTPAMEQIEPMMRTIHQADADAAYDCPLIAILQNQQVSQENRFNLIKKLLQNGANPHKRQNVTNNEYRLEEVTAVQLAARNAYIDVLELLLEFKVQDAKIPSIFQLTTPNDLDLLIAIVSRKPNQDELILRPEAPVHYDAENWQMFSLLIKNGCRIEAFVSLIIMRVSLDNKQIRKYLLDRCSQLPPFQQAALAFFLMKTNDLASLAMLLDKGVISLTATLKTGITIINAKWDSDQKTTTYNSQYGLGLLHLAVLTTNVVAIKFLIKHGINKHFIADNGMSSYDYAKQIDNELHSALKKGKTQVLLNQIAQIKAIKKILAQQGIALNVSRTKEEKCQQVLVATVGVITGIDKQGKRVIVLGRKQKQPMELSAFMFPGGLKDIKDENFFLAALREVKEETGLNIQGLLQEGKATQSLLHCFKKVSANGKTLNHIEFYQFDLGEHINQLRVYPLDDLKIVRIIPIEHIVQKSLFAQYSVKTTSYGRESAEETPLLTSNGVLIDMLLGKATSEQLDATLALENDGYGMLCQAAFEGDERKIANYVEEAQIPLFNRDSDTSPLIEASKAGQYRSIQLLLQLGAIAGDRPDANYSNTAINHAIKNKHYPIIKKLCSITRAINTYDVLAMIESNDPLIVDIVLKCLCKQAPILDEYYPKSVFMYALYAAIQQRMEHYAWKLLPYFKDSKEEANKLLLLMRKQAYTKLAAAFEAVLKKPMKPPRTLEDDVEDFEDTYDTEKLVTHHYHAIMSIYKTLKEKQVFKLKFFKNLHFCDNKINIINEISVKDIVNASPNSHLGRARDEICSGFLRYKL